MKKVIVLILSKSLLIPTNKRRSMVSRSPETASAS